MYLKHFTEVDIAVAYWGGTALYEWEILSITG
jgi:hypothetical protein